jgi:Uma2 family endonuclease
MQEGVPMVETRQRLTEEEFLALPDDGRKYELVDGEAKEVPTFLRHGKIALALAILMAELRRFGDLFDSSTGFRMAGGNIRSPDVSFVRKDRLPEDDDLDQFLDGAPDLCVEIISPSEDRHDIYRKLFEYFESGAQEVWHVFPEARRVVVHRSLDDVHTLRENDELESPDLLPGFRCRVRDLFDA